MKVTLFSVIALAASAIASPCAVQPTKPAATKPVAVATKPVPAATKPVAVATSTGSSPVATGVTKNKNKVDHSALVIDLGFDLDLDVHVDLDVDVAVNVDIDLNVDLNVDIQLETKVGLIATLESYVKVCEDVTASINLLIADVTSGKITKEQCSKAAVPLIKKLASSLSLLVKGFAAITIDLDIFLDADITIIADLIVKLVSTITLCLKNLVVVCGLSVDLTAVLKVCLDVLGKVVIGCGSFVTIIIPTLEINLKSIVIDLGVSVLAPCLGSVLSSASGLTVALGVYVNL